MALTIFHRKVHNVKVVIINENEEEKQKIQTQKLTGKFRLNRHTRSETKVHD